VAIGQAVDDTSIYLLEDNLQLLPSGVVGEIYIGGKPLAIGYLDDARLTDTRFVDDPFMPRQRIYRSGDNCHWDPNGQLRFVARTDNVVFNMLTLPKLDM
jgi:non-ribosomal peptide synthetase component F